MGAQIEEPILQSQINDRNWQRLHFIAQEVRVLWCNHSEGDRMPQLASSIRSQHPLEQTEQKLDEQ